MDWKVDFLSFPKVPHMTYFEYHKASKSYLEKEGKKLSKIPGQKR